ncbi:unknown protein [Microcystis aeruginosa NIES-843]|uniref:Uncharacterized protein n=1 Tax=Microcystis aeruginosa (strain NIES-843 / IAM M-2473) TaxID=449447 RepID=B0JY91_MICAN|nr:unknown protein [Microcystis aeruginosa NIES-843]
MIVSQGFWGNYRDVGLIFSSFPSSTWERFVEVLPEYYFKAEPSTHCSLNFLREGF